MRRSLSGCSSRPCEISQDRNLCCNAHTWAKVSWSNRIGRNYTRLKITGSGGILWTRFKKIKEPTATSEMTAQEQGPAQGDRAQHQEAALHPRWGSAPPSPGKEPARHLPAS